MKQPNNRKLVIYADGAITPQRAGAGAIAHDGHGEILLIANRTLPVMTNTEAEYAGLMLALELARQFRLPVEIRLDSEVVVFQMAGRYAVNSPRLKKWHREACALARSLPSITYQHVPRELNELADALAAEAAAGRRWRMKGSACSG